MKKIVFGILLVFYMTTLASAVPLLQVGAPAGPGDNGDYADYIAYLSNPYENDTAVTSGGTIYVAGAYKNSNIDLIGGQFMAGDDWTDITGQQGQFFDDAFAGAGAILMATVPDGSLASGSLTVSSASECTGVCTKIYATDTFEQNFVMPNPPSNHDPVKNQDYLFFDIGDFDSSGVVMNFDSESGAVDGQIKSLTIAASGFGWIHFDVLALITEWEVDTVTGNKHSRTRLVSNYVVDLAGNPGSKDVTWKETNGSIPVPEPLTILMLGSGLLGLGFYRRRTGK